MGSTAFKVEVDPQPSANGQVIIYAALSGRNGGIWRSDDTGAHWQLMRSGQATDLILDPSSNTGGSGNLQVLYGAFQGDGIYISPNRGQTWNLMVGGVGNPLIIDRQDHASVPVAGNATPNGGLGRIVLAKPALTDSPVENQIYAGWLYAAVSNTDNTLNGIFMTKDFGQNWVQVRIPTLPPVTGFTPAIPSNDVTLGDYNVLGTQGNYDIALAVDPTNPNVIYLGGQHAPNTGTGMVRVDTTAIWDAHNMTLRSDVANDGAIDLSSTGPVTTGAYPPNPYTEYYPPFLLTDNNYLNFIRNPRSPFDAGSTLFVYNLGQFTNNGFGATWTPFDVSGTDYHRFFTMIDPTTGLPRIVFGNDQGVWSVIDDHGVQLAGSSVGTQPTPSMDRNGNLQITQFYYGAVQPSNTGVAASYDHALFYGSSQDNSGPSSAGNVLTTGNINWNATGEGATPRESPRTSKGLAPGIRRSGRRRCPRTWERPSSG